MEKFSVQLTPYAALSHLNHKKVIKKAIKTAMKKSVYLFSMDSDQFYAAPTTTATLQAYYQQYGQHSDNTEFELIHFNVDDDVEDWINSSLNDTPTQTLFGLSFYTWNTAAFLELSRAIKNHCPDALIVAGGPHVQQAEDFLFDEAIDIVVLGEGEITFTKILDAINENENENKSWQQVKGIAYLNDEGALVKNPLRNRIKELDTIPSPYDVLSLSDNNGKALYDAVSYETSRGCPFTCAFCEWGTGAIGTKMLEFSLERIHKDWEIILNAGIKDIWLADSNFGALKNDFKKTELLIELKKKTGLPNTFATSWSKSHSPQVQKIVRLLHQHDLLPHYQLALQTLTPEALKLSNRENMKANKYEPIAKQLAKEGIPIACELIWGLPGDNLNDFENNLNTLLKVFPNVNIFGYTLLPGTEFYKKRELYQIKTIAVAGYGKAHGEYVVGCHSFSEQEGREGYFLISAYIIFVHGYLLPLTARYLTLLGSKIVGASLGKILRDLLHGLIKHFKNELPDLDWDDQIVVYENRSIIYLTLLKHRDECIKQVQYLLPQILKNLNKEVEQTLAQTIVLDALFCPRYGSQQTINTELDFDGKNLKQTLESMHLPEGNNHLINKQRLEIFHSGGAGVFLKDPDGGSWIKGKIIEREFIEELAVS